MEGISMGQDLVKSKKTVSGGHWYNSEGKPCHTYINAKGQKKNTTLREARKLNLYPSVTTITGLIKSQQLIKWWKTNLLRMSFNNPMRSGESFEEYSSRIYTKVQEFESIAPELGTEIHKAIEDYIKHNRVNKKFSTEVMLVSNWLNMYNEFPRHCEKSIKAGKCGYGGTVDLITEKSIIDFKTTKTKGKKKIQPYSHYLSQLSAYKNALIREDLKYKDYKCTLLYISTDEVGRIEHYTLTSEDELRGWRSFSALHIYWQEDHKYNLMGVRDERN